MSRRTFIGDGFEIEDVNGSFEKFIRDTPKIARKCFGFAVEQTRFALERRMEHNAPMGPDAPHLKETVSSTQRGLTAQVGYIEGKGGDDPSRSDVEQWNGMTVTNAWVAMFNEFNPNKNRFMTRSAEEEARDFRKRMEAACGLIERNLAGGGGLL